ncbi:MAG: acyl carrier protein [Eubacteriales bacterium]|nr:acyl carrier protein [Eubacteriales bacterium]
MTFDKIKELIVDQLGVDEDMVEMDTNLMKDLEADSLDAVEIILGIEEAFGLEIPDEEAEKFETVRDLVEYVDSHEE